MNKFLQYLSFIILGSTIFIILILFNIIAQYQLSTSTVNLNSILGQTIPSLTGAFFSGLFAYLIYKLTTINEKKKLIEQSNNSLSIIRQEIEENKQNITNLKQAFTVSEPKNYAQMLDQEKDLPESPLFNMLIIIDSKFSTQITDNLLTNLSSKDYVSVANELKYIKFIIKSMSLLIQKNLDIDNRTILIENIIANSEKLEMINQIDNTPSDFKSGEYYILSMAKKLIIILAIFYSINLIINYFIN